LNRLYFAEAVRSLSPSRRRHGHGKAHRLCRAPSRDSGQTNGAAFVDESPADGVGFFFFPPRRDSRCSVLRMRAGVEPVWPIWVRVRQKRQHGLAFAARSTSRFAAAQRTRGRVVGNCGSIFPPRARASGRRPVSSSTAPVTNSSSASAGWSGRRPSARDAKPRGAFAGFRQVHGHRFNLGGPAPHSQAVWAAGVNENEPGPVARG